MRARNVAGTTPLNHVIVACQENRAFDHYFGYYPKAGPYGVPPAYAQPDGHGGLVQPRHLASPITGDTAHDWGAIHDKWDNGRMDGFYTTGGSLALGYYNADDLAYYYALADTYALCGNFFCSLLGPTNPNRIYLGSATSGGATTNTITRGSLRWPTILDLLDQAGVDFKVYNGFGGIAAGFNPFSYFARWVDDPRVNHDDDEYFADLRDDTLPRFSFIVPNVVSCEHPPASIAWGQHYIQRRVQALMQSPAWASAAFILTYDEGGGFFDHVPPPRLDAYGPGIRIPTVVVSPYARPGHISPTFYDHGSILKLVEAVFELPTLASINHQFDQQTPAANNDAAAPGAADGPPAPPRDGDPATGNLLDVFDFDQAPRAAHILPPVTVAGQPDRGIEHSILQAVRDA